MGDDIKKPDNSKLIREAILMDGQLRLLTARRAEMISRAIPTLVLKDGKSKIIWVDEKNSPFLPQIEQMIEQRIEQIKDFYK